MHTTRKFWFVLFGAVLGLAVIACSCGSTIPMLTSTPTPTSAPLPTSTSVPTNTPPVANPLPGLAGNWQTGEIVFTIEWQDGQYVLTGIHAAGTSTRTLESQSWDGSKLAWTYTYSDENGDSTITYKTISVEGDTLTANRSTADGESSQRLLRRVASSTPDYYRLPISDDFSNPASGWDIFSTSEDSAGYADGTYFVISKTKKFSSFGASGRFFGDTVIDVDAAPASGPTGNNFSYDVGCRVQSIADGYLFEVEADGYYAVGYYTGGGKTYTSLLSGDDWQPSSAIKQGMKTNHLTVTCAGTTLRFEINGTLVYTGQDSTFTEGDICLGAATYDDNNVPAEVHFDNLAVKLP